MDNFNNIKHQLENNSKIFLEIKKLPEGMDIVSSKVMLGAEGMKELAGSIDNYFLEEIKNKGIETIQVQLWEKRGNAKIRLGIAHRLKLGESSKNEKRPEYQQQKPSQPQVEHHSFGLNGTGLSMPEIIRLEVDRERFMDTKTELQEEKTERKKLEKENENLKEQIRGWERKSDSKEFWGGLFKELTPALTGLAAAVKPGLNGPQSEPALEGIKGNLIQVIKEAPSITDEQGMAAFHVLNAYAQGNQEFISSLLELFKTHNIDGNNNS